MADSLFNPQGPLGGDQISTGVPGYQFGPDKGYGIKPDGTPMTSQELYAYNKSMGSNPFANEPGRDASGQIIPGYGQTDSQIQTTGMGMGMMAPPSMGQGFYGSSNPMSMDVVFNKTDLTPDQFYQQQIDQMNNRQQDPMKVSKAIPPPDLYGGMTPGDALGGGLTQTNPATGQPFGATQPTPAEQLNTPSFEQLAQPMPAPAPPSDYAMPPPPPPSVTPLPITQPTPGTSNLINQISAPVTQAPTQLPVTSPGANNLIQQIKAPTQIKPVATPNPATRQFAQQFRPQPIPQPRPQPVARPQPVMAPKPVARPQPQPVMAQRPMATSVSRVNPPLLPSRPMGRR